jgi:hypothetical protein
MNDVKELCISGLVEDAAHHKTWYFEEILKEMGYDLEEIRAQLLREGHEWEPGIPPLGIDL